MTSGDYPQSSRKELVGQRLEWARSESGLQLPLAGMYLGKIVTANGPISFQDAVDTPVPAAGIMFSVRQSSDGFTGIFTKPLAGRTVEALVFDNDTQTYSWEGLASSRDEIVVHADRGNMKATSLEEWVTTPNLLGNAGARGGAVRVTDETGEVRYFLLGADFQGEPDNWHVRGAIVEVQPASVVAAPAVEQSAPPELEA